MATPIDTSVTSESTVASSMNVLTQHNDNARTGANLQETILNTSNVNTTQFAKLCDRPVDGHIYAQPLYVSNVNIPGKGVHNVIYIATMHNSVYAFDADNVDITDPNSDLPLWKTSLKSSIPLPDARIGPTHNGQPVVNGQPTYRDISIEVGIISTPVISLEHNALYVVCTTRENNYSHWLYALDLGTGLPKFGGPVQLKATYPGTIKQQNGTITHTTLTFTSNLQNQRPALLLTNDTIYIAFAAYGDQGAYNGWILAYSATTLHQTAVFNTTAHTMWNASVGEGGIWQAGQGPAADTDSSVYVLTGNGAFNNDANGLSLGDSFIKLRPNLTILDWFTPSNNAALNSADADVGSSGVVLLPNTNFVLGGGKESKFFLLQKNSMGHFNATGNQVNQEFYVHTPDNAANPLTMQAGQTHHIHGGPVYWNGPNGAWIYIWVENDSLKAYPFDGKQFQPNAVAKCSTTPSAECLGMPGGAISLSANGNQAGTGILWASHPHKQPLNADANQHVVTGILRAYDATSQNGQLTELWNSEMMTPATATLGPDSIGNFAKFCAPTIANGKVYLASFGYGAGGTDKSSYHFSIYGLLPTSNALLSNAISAAAQGSDPGSMSGTAVVDTSSADTLSPDARSGGI